ncbi:unnamed protein product [Caenorhabditis angaria]|uniref:Uncharacterized protein n=1 Tax=Caenorhabditis angaria TaxID=860376 RepID=A0A9P1I3S2_9PELO|nr:unnamed protein product [Caenorhabditis angaria]
MADDEEKEQGYDVVQNFKPVDTENSFKFDDSIEVIDGEWMNLRGIGLTMEDQNVVMVLFQDGMTEVTINASQLQKSPNTEDRTDEEIDRKYEKEEAEIVKKEMESAKKGKCLRQKKKLECFENEFESQRNDGDNDADDLEIDDISRNGTLPPTKDSTLWIVKCRKGQEKLTRFL